MMTPPRGTRPSRRCEGRPDAAGPIGARQRRIEGFGTTAAVARATSGFRSEIAKRERVNDPVHLRPTWLFTGNRSPPPPTWDGPSWFTSSPSADIDDGAAVPHRRQTQASVGEPETSSLERNGSPSPVSRSLLIGK